MCISLQKENQGFEPLPVWDHKIEKWALWIYWLSFLLFASVGIGDASEVYNNPTLIIVQWNCLYFPFPFILMFTFDFLITFTTMVSPCLIFTVWFLYHHYFSTSTDLILAYLQFNCHTHEHERICRWFTDKLFLQ